jgi:phytoene dehydrogenase-like protein
MALHTANIVGSGPNGLAAAIALAQAGVTVNLYERRAQIGGACSTAELTLPGFRHDVGSSVYPLGVASPFFRSLRLEREGLRFLEPNAPLAHPLDDGSAVMLEHDLAATAEGLGAHDGRAWQTLLGPTVRDWPVLLESALRPLLGIPRHPLALLNFGLAAGWPARGLARSVFRNERARSLFAGCAAHSVIPLTTLGSSAAGLMLAAAGHTTGWPVAEGGAQSLSNALASRLRSLGGGIWLNADIAAISDMGEADATLFDTSPGACARIAGDRLTPAFRARLQRFRPGPGTFKVDWALSEPIPWRARDCRRAATVHLGGSLDEIVQSEADAWAGRHNPRPFVLLVQPSLFDTTRAPAGQHTAWAYCHAPSGSTHDLTAAIEAQVERFAPGFRECILARRTANSAELEAWNPNLVDGNLSGGAMTVGQLVARPTLRQYRTSNPRLFLCSASTPPGGGVHGMCGFGAAQATLHDLG